VHGERHQSDADAAAAVCEQCTRETCVRARYRTIYGRHDIVRSTNPRSISRYRVIDMITTILLGPSRNQDWRIPWGTSQLVTRSTRHTAKSCDELTVMSDGVGEALKTSGDAGETH